LLQDSLGGNAFTLCIVCISPAAVNYNETLATLRFATRAKAIKTKVTKNVDPAAARMNELIAENKALRDLMGGLETACKDAGLADLLAKVPAAPPVSA
jgi:kinesin family protein 4/21/27